MSATQRVGANPTTTKCQRRGPEAANTRDDRDDLIAPQIANRVGDEPVSSSLGGLQHGPRPKTLFQVDVVSWI